VCEITKTQAMHLIFTHIVQESVSNVMGGGRRQEMGSEAIASHEM